MREPDDDKVDPHDRRTGGAVRQDYTTHATSPDLLRPATPPPGSARAARRAGIAVAASAPSSIVAPTTAKVTGSRADIRKSSGSTQRPATAASASPMATLVAA